MILRYIALFIDSNFDSGIDDNFSNKFNLETRFISHYLSIAIRKLKFKTDNSFKMIGVCPSVKNINECKIVGGEGLRVRIEIDKEKFNTMNQIEKDEYCLELLEKGYKIASQKKQIPLEYLLKINDDFRAIGYKNEWQHKKKKFKEQGIEVILNCSFTSAYFRLTIIINDIVKKKQLISGLVAQTLPDEVFFDHLFKDIIIKDGKLIITEYLDRPKFIFSLTDIFMGVCRMEVTKEGINYEKAFIDNV